MSSFMKKLFKFIPEVEAPVEKPTLNTRLKWTLLVLAMVLEMWCKELRLLKSLIEY
jgi:hypothetical protein